LPNPAWYVFLMNLPRKCVLTFSSAAPFQWAAIFHKDDINFKHGHHNLEWYDPTTKSTEHQLPCKVRCSFCHSPIMDEGRNMILLFPSLIKFKSDQDKKNFAPRYVNFENTSQICNANHS
jgi:hypothetical protein